MLRSDIARSDWIQPLDAKWSRFHAQRSASSSRLLDASYNLVYSDDIQTGSGSNLAGELEESDWAQHGHHTHASQSSVWAPRLEMNTIQQKPLDFPDSSRVDDHETQSLLQRFQNSELYKKYRIRQQKDKKSDQGQKWPDEVEEAFFRALIKYPSMGRQMLLHKGKQSGRNELIADEIMKVTGEKRTRKQVSSHIQVLKPFFKHDSQIMELLSGDDIGKAGQRRTPRDRRASSMMQRSLYRHESPYAQHGASIKITPDPTAITTFDKHIGRIEPVSFQIFVQQVQSGCVYRLHTYTQSVKRYSRTDLVMSDTAMLQQNFPQVAHMHARTPLTCDVIIADSSLALPVDAFENLPGVELGVQLQFLSRLSTPDVPVRSHSTFFHNGQAFPNQTDPPSTLSFVPADYGPGSEAAVKFGSSFWAKHLSHLSQKIQETAHLDSRTIHADVSAYIGGITALQHITMADRHGHYQSVLVISWTFRQSDDRRGSTTWSNLILPAAPLSMTGDLQSFVPPEPLIIRTNPAFDHVYSHGLPVGGPGSMLTSIDHGMHLRSTLSSSDGRTSYSPDSALSSYSWSDAAYPEPVEWFTAKHVNTATLPRRDPYVLCDPLLDLSNTNAALLDDSCTIPAGTATERQLQHYTKSWRTDPFSTATDAARNSLAKNPNAYNEDVLHNYAEGRVPHLDGSEIVHDQYATAVEDLYDLDLEVPSQPMPWEVEGVSPRTRNDMSPTHDKMTVLPASREQSVAYSLSERRHSIDNKHHGAQSLQRPWHTSLYEPRFHGLPSRHSTVSPFDCVSMQENSLFDFDQSLCHSQTGPE